MLIGVAHDNPLLYSRIYKVEYMNGHKSVLSNNTIAKNMLAWVDKEGNRYALLNTIVDNLTDGSKVMPYKSFIKSKNGGHCKH